MSIDVMRQALEALENVYGKGKRCEAAIAALRAAIEQAQPQTVPAESGLAEKVPVKYTLLEQTLMEVWDEMPHADYQKEMEQETELETYKRLYELRGKALERPCINCGHQPAKIKAMAQPVQEPVAWMTFDAAGEEDDIWYDNPDGKLLEGWTYKPLYTAPRQWQGLTADEIWDEWNEQTKPERNRQNFVAAFARGIEAKLKEKNHG